MHRRAKLTVFGRRLLVERIELEGWPIAHAAAMTGVSRQTATKWVRRYRTEGLAGLEDRSSRPRRSPRRLAPEQVAAILAARHELGVGPHRLAPVVGSPRSTIGDVLRRHGLSRLGDRDRPSGVPIRYVRERPGELLHIDVKKLGRIPDGGGHRFRGRGHGTPKSGAGYDYIHQAVDDMSRVAFAEVFDDERGPTCARFLRDAAAWFARQGVQPHSVTCDEVTADPRQVVHGILDRLGVDPPPAWRPDPKQRRQADEINADWVRRYRAARPRSADNTD